MVQTVGMVGPVVMGVRVSLSIMLDRGIVITGRMMSRMMLAVGQMVVVRHILP